MYVGIFLNGFLKLIIAEKKYEKGYKGLNHKSISTTKGLKGLNHKSGK